MTLVTAFDGLPIVKWTFVGLGVPVGVFVAVLVAVLVAVAVAVFVGLGDAVGVFVAVPVAVGVPAVHPEGVVAVLRGTGAVTTSKSALLLSVS